MFGLKAMAGWGTQLVRGIFSFGKSSVDDALSGTVKKNYTVLSKNWKTNNPGVKFDDDIRKELVEQAEELAEASGASLTKKAVTGVGLAAGAGAITLGVDGAIRGKDSFLSAGLENAMEAGKIPDAITDTQSFFEKIKEFIRQIAEFIEDPKGFVFNTDKASTPSLDNSNANSATLDTATGDVTLNSDKTFSQKFGDYAEGLAQDADPSNWSIKGTVNLAHSIGHGGTKGLLSTVSWVGGQALDVLNVGDVFSDKDFSSNFANATADAVDTGFDKTVGLPDLDGHWAHAVNNVAAFAAPGGAALKVGKGLSKAFGLTEATTTAGRAANVVATNAPTMVEQP